MWVNFCVSVRCNCVLGVQSLSIFQVILSCLKSFIHLIEGSLILLAQSESREEEEERMMCDLLACLLHIQSDPKRLKVTELTQSD